MWVGIHQSAKAKHDGIWRHTTVGGGTESNDTTLLEAMRRELKEEYGTVFASECLIEELPIPTETNKGTSGTVKTYTWFLIIHQGPSEPVLQAEECAAFRWCTLASIENGISLEFFSDGKRRMLLRSLEAAKSIRPSLFKE